MEGYTEETEDREDSLDCHHESILPRLVRDYTSFK